MNGGDAQYMLVNYIKLKCPLCEEKCRLRVSMHAHLRTSHTDEEFKSFIKKQEKPVEDMHDMANKLEIEKENKMLEDEQKLNVSLDPYLEYAEAEIEVLLS